MGKQPTARVGHIVRAPHEPPAGAVDRIAEHYRNAEPVGFQHVGGFVGFTDDNVPAHVQGQIRRLARRMRRAGRPLPDVGLNST